MDFIFVWLIQLFIFFAIVTSVASFLTKVTKRANTQEKRVDPSKLDAPMHPVGHVETTKRNEQKPAKKNNRPVREDRYTRTPRVRDTIRQSNKPMIKDVVTIKDPYRAADKKVVSTLFNTKSLKQAVIYKEILDKPVSMRDE